MGEFALRILLSTIGSRGEVQPIAALALELRWRGHEVRVCAPPDFQQWTESMGIPYVPVGPELHSTAKPSSELRKLMATPEGRAQLVNDSVADQFRTVRAAAEGCAVVVAGGALQAAARSVAEERGIRYVYASYCPITLPSPHHAPPVFAVAGMQRPEGELDNRELWETDARRWNDMWGPAINSQRKALGLASVADIRGHIFTDRPLLATDRVLGPWPEPAELDVRQTGAWILRDVRPLSDELTAFLDAGEPPVYFGFGSVRAPEDASRVAVQAARALGRRVILMRGWADLSLVDDGDDCIAIGEVNQQALFRRCAAVVHHGGAGTTTAAALSGAPQVIVPQMFDQFYWASRVDRLGIGHAHEGSTPTAESLASALRHALEPEVIARAGSVAAEVRTDGAAVAAECVLG